MSHAAILAHSLGIPCVMGLVGGLDNIRTDGLVILDGTSGTVLTDPTPAEIAEAESEAERRRQFDAELEAVGAQPAETIDGVRVALRGNIDLPEGLDPAADGALEGGRDVDHLAGVPDAEDQIERDVLLRDIKIYLS